MELPGGLLLDGRLQRDFSFKPVTGDLERVVSESSLGIHTLAEQVSFILANTLDDVAGLPASKKVVRSLSSGDRQYLMLQLEAIIEPEPQWLSSVCRDCSEIVQFQFVPGTLPVKAAGEGFPQTRLALSIGEVCLRGPTGDDEEAIARGPNDPQSAMQLLLDRLLSMPGQTLDIASLTPEDQQLIDQVLEQMTPQPGVSASIQCPYCSSSQVVAIDGYAWICRETRGLDEDIHTLAFRYHWSEKEILKLPRKRRKHYIKLIERSLGKYQADDLIQGLQGSH